MFTCMSLDAIKMLNFKHGKFYGNMLYPSHFNTLKAGIDSENSIVNELIEGVVFLFMC